MKFIFITMIALGAVSCSKKPIAEKETVNMNVQKDTIPYGTPGKDKPGFVTSPYSPSSGFIDVRGFPPNTEVKDPYSGKIFLVP